ncbi:MAG: hypothetical protein LBT14_03415 [Treponema sp.]|nr:hypothetical protein [Treponema sp.]
MLKHGYVIGFVLMLCACAGSPPHDPEVAFEGVAQGEMIFFNTAPLNNELVFIGVAGIRFNRDEAIRFALEDAAKKVAFFHGIEGRVEYSEQKGLGFLDYSSANKTSLDFDQDYQRYIEELEYDPETDVLIDNLVVFVRTRYTGWNSIRINHRFSSTKTKPEWVENPPKELFGLYAGVGYANPRLYHKDTVIASYENAVHTIITNIFSEVHGSSETTKDSQDTLGSFNARTGGTVSAQGKLTGFYVLEIWVDPVNRAVWTLTVAEEGEALVQPVLPEL